MLYKGSVLEGYVNKIRGIKDEKPKTDLESLSKEIIEKNQKQN